MAAKLHRSLSLVSLVAYGMGMIIGAGIYSVVGSVAGHSGNELWLSFIVASVPALLAALSYAELSSAIPKTGAEYQYFLRAFPKIPSLGFMLGLIIAVTGATTAATVSMAFAGYFQTFVPAPFWMPAAGLLVACGTIAFLGIREATKVTLIFTVLEVLGLLLVIGLGFLVDSPREQPGTVFHPGVFQGAAISFFIFTGFEALANLSEETKNPTRDLPRALLISLGLTTALYLLVSFAALRLLPASELAKSSSPLSAAIGGSYAELAPVLAGIALCSTANTALISMMVATRILYGMAQGGGMPQLLGAIHGKRRTPWVATLFVVGIAVGLLAFGDLGWTASLSSFASLVAFSAVHVAVLVLRFKEPGLKRPFRVWPGMGKVPMVPVLGLLSIGFLMLFFEASVYRVGALAVGVSWGIAILSSNIRSVQRPR